MKIVSSNEFDTEIKEKTVFVDFYADWCGPCKMMAPIIEEIEKELTNIKFIKVNVDEAEEIAVRYGIMSIPTFFIFNNGELVKKTVGGHSKQEMIGMANIGEED